VAATPRLIQGVSDEANVLLGPFILGLANHYKTRFGYQICFASGRTAEEMGKWFDDMVQLLKPLYFLNNDFSKFDSTIHSAAIAFELWLYQRCGIGVSAAAIATAQLKTVGYTSCFMYTRKATRKSGDPNTSLGNSILNAIVTISALLAAGAKWGDFAIAVNGDDGFVLLRYKIDMEKFYACMARAGFVSKASLYPFCEIHMAEFCSASFWPTADGTVLALKPGKFLASTPWHIGEVSDPDAWYGGVMCAYRNSYSFLPALDAFINRNLKHADAITSFKKVKEYARREVVRYYVPKRRLQPCADTFEFFAVQYACLYSDFARCLDFPVAFQTTRNSSIICAMMEKDTA